MVSFQKVLSLLFEPPLLIFSLYSLWENRTAHIDLCLTIGRGHATFKENLNNSILSDSTLRSNIVKEVSSFCLNSEQDAESQTTGWPLSLSSPHHALILSNLTCQPIPDNSDEAAAEYFICNGFAESIKTFLSTCDSKGLHRSIEEDIPLSHRDSRLFVIAVGRMPKKEQLKFLSEFLKDTKNILAQERNIIMNIISKNCEMSGFLGRLVTVISILIDVVIVGKPLMNNFSRLAGPTNYSLPRLSESFKLIDADDTLPEDCNWYTRERCFLGLSLDWESPNVPLVTDPIEAEYVNPRDLKNALTIIMLTMEAGFHSAKFDHCHLLYSSWNASIKVNAWDQESVWEGPVIGLEKKIEDEAKFLMLLREDLCGMHRLLNKQDTHRKGTILSWILTQKAKESNINISTRDVLKNGLTNALSLLSSEVSDFSLQSKSQVPSVPKLAVLESLAIYICFLISNHTVQEDGFFSQFNRDKKSKSTRTRNNSANSGESMDEDGMMEEDERNIMSDDSGESDGGYPDFDDEDEEEAKLDALGGLHDACNAIGAAPIHPDWLDPNCRLREGIDIATALASGEAVLGALTELVQVAYTNFKKSLKVALNSKNDNENEKGNMTAESDLALSILSCFTREEISDLTPIDYEPQPINDSIITIVSSICNIENEMITKMMDGLSQDKIQSVREAWCPNATHCIHGKLQDPSPDGWEVTSGEQRAAGEWEFLLADVFLSSFFGNEGVVGENVSDSNKNNEGVKDRGEKEKDVKVSEKNLANDALVEVERWAHILFTAVSCIVPASALFRFALNDGKGQSFHPLSKRERATSESLLTITPFDIVNANENSAIRLDSSFKNQAFSTISKTLGVLTCISADGIVPIALHNVCQAASTHLVNDPTTIVNLVGSHRLQFCEAALSMMMSTIRNNEKICCSDAWSEIIYNVITCIECHSGQTIMETFVPKKKQVESKGRKVSITNAAPIKKLRFRRLLSHLGFFGLVTIENILDNTSESCLQSVKEVNMTLSEFEESNLISLFFEILTHDKLSLETQCRINILSLIDKLLAAERKCSVSMKNNIIGSDPITLLSLNAWNRLESKDIIDLVRKDLCMLDQSTFNIISSRHVCSIIYYILGSLDPESTDVQTDKTSGCRLVLLTLLDTLEEWARAHNSSREHILNLLCLLATRFNELKQTGKRLLAFVTTAVDNMGMVEVGQRLVSLENFYRFVSDIISGMEQLKALTLQTNKLQKERNTFMEYFQSSPKEKRLGTQLQISSDKSRMRNPSSTSLKKSFLTNSGKKVLRTCSYVETGGEFTEQHWYICYTCGLLWDKGCCSLCAQVCHRGHDVGYSRQSSFFCDCGAEGSNPGDDMKASCKCLKPLPIDELSSVYNDESDGLSFTSPITAKDQVKTFEDSKTDANHSYRKKAILIALHSFPSVTESSILRFLEVLRVTGWTESLFMQFNRCFEEWAKRKNISESFMISSNLSASSRDLVSDTPTWSKSKREQQCIRDGKPLTLKPMKKDTMEPIRVTKSNCFNMKLPFDTLADRTKKTSLTKNEIHRCAVISDSRGRLIIAEPYALIFCSALPITNIRHVPNSVKKPIDRSELCIMGTSKIKMSIMGLSLCPANERHLVVWGISEACVVTLNKSCNAIENTISLSIELEPHECDTEYLLKCEWVPGSETLVLAVCGTFLKVFDIRRSNTSAPDKDVSCRSTTCYTMGYEDVLIRSATMISDNHNIYSIENIKQLISNESHGEARNFQIPDVYKDESNSSIIKKPQEYAVQLVLLLDTGRLSVTELRIDENGDLEDQGESYIECGDGLRFPIIGVKRVNPSIQGSTSTSFGEGSSLHYLHQSQLLLYKCVSAPLIAMRLDKSGKIVGSFELLPHVITADMLGSSSNGQSISAPYSHWTELGSTFSGNEMVYRVSCVGKSTRTHQPKLLLIEFSESTVHIKDLESDLGYSLNSSIEGLASFSAPLLVGKGSEDGSYSNEAHFLERTLLATIQSNGSIYFFGEKFNTQRLCSHESDFEPSLDPYSSSDDPAISKEKKFKTSMNENELVQPSFPLTIFETLINISENEELILGGDGIQNEPDARLAKEKLKISNGDFIRCPSRIGCTLTYNLSGHGRNSDKEKHGYKFSTNTDHHNAHKLSPLVIVAIRIQIGSSTTEYLPSQLTVMGRKIHLIRGVKRWYDVHLTDEEIMLGIRSGCVCIGIGDSADASNSPIIDAVEVYGKRRDDIQFLNDCSLEELEQKDFSSQQLKWYTRDFKLHDPEKEGHKEALISSISCVTHVCRILKEQVDPSHVNRAIIQRLVQMTALDSGKGEVRDYVLDLLKEVEPDSLARQVLMDEGTLLGIAEELMKLRKVCETQFLNKGNEDGSKESRGRKLQNEVGSDRLNQSERGKDMNNLIKCLRSSILIVNERPKNYQEVIKKLVCNGNLQDSIAVEARMIFDVLMQHTKSNSMSLKKWLIEPTTISIGMKRRKNTFGSGEAASYLTELTLLEMAIANQECLNKEESEKKPFFYASFDVIRDLLQSNNNDIIQSSCVTIAKILDSGSFQGMETVSTKKNMKNMVSNHGNITETKGQSQPIAYCCDSCGLFPITSLRYTLEGEDIDLCKKCFDDGKSFATKSTSSGDMAVEINDKKLTLGKEKTIVNCSQILQMQSIEVEKKIVEQVRKAKLVKGTSTSNPELLLNKSRTNMDTDDADLELALKKSLQCSNPADQHLQIDDVRENELRPLSEYLQKDYLFDMLLGLSIQMTFFLVEMPVENQSEADKNTRGFYLGVNHLHQLLLYLILHASSSKSRKHRGKMFADEMTRNLSQLVQEYLNGKLDEKTQHLARIAMIISLKSLSRLRLTKDAQSISLAVASDDLDFDYEKPSKTKDKTDPRFVCDVHGVPAVRRRCSRGIHKDRRFYLCGKDRESRCDYFRWADDDDSSKATSTTFSSSNLSRQLSGPCNIMQLELLKLFSQQSSKDSSPLQAKLCDLLQTSYQFTDENSIPYIGRESLSSKQLADEEKLSPGRASRSSSSHLESLLSERTVMEDWFDGAIISRMKLRPFSDSSRSDLSDEVSCKRSGTELGLTPDESNHYLVQASLFLLSHLATNSLSSVSNKQVTMTSSWSSGWFSLLCEILSTSSKKWSHQRQQAKNMLKKLCGGRKETYHRVCDHYVFAFQFKKLLLYCEDSLLAAIEVKEKARQCGPNWNKGQETSWVSLSPGGLFGVDDLISEDSLTTKFEERVRVILEYFIDATKNRGGNWRKFCAMITLPLINSSNKEFDSQIHETSMYKRPTVFFLMWLACSLNGSNQVKILRLIEVALTKPKSLAESVPSLKREKDASVVHDSMLKQEKNSADVNLGTGMDSGKPSIHSLIFLQDETRSPEDVLLDTKSGMDINDVYTFVMQFVLRGKSVELRRISALVAEKMFPHLSKSDINIILLRFMSESMVEVGSLGQDSLEFLKLVQNLILCFGSCPILKFEIVSALIVECFIEQIKALSASFYYKFVESEESFPGGSEERNRLSYLDLGSCVHCHRDVVGAPDSKNITDTSSNASRLSSSTRSSKSGSLSYSISAEESNRGVSHDKKRTKQKNERAWLPGQVRPYNRSRLDSLSEKVVSTEFATYIQLKCRQAISDVHVTISDPRGRLVKTIGVFFSPRQVGNVAELKQEDYCSSWQQCGTIFLVRGSLRASCSLSLPVVAANLKLEYQEFHEKVGGAKTSDGRMILTCPRCTRVVNNNHGVCAHCGEVAFQCRKCRHINYDRLDAFLCVECGYCASGGFVYELTSGNASNAVAIIDKESYDRALKFLQISSRRLGETKSNLRSKILSMKTPTRKRHYPGDPKDFECFNKYGPALKRALLGEMPKIYDKDSGANASDSLGRRRSAAAIVASRRGDQSSVISAANKARSMLSLVRQLRSESLESGFDGERAGRGDNLVRQALLNVGGSGGGIEIFDDSGVFGDDGDVFGIINGSRSGNMLQRDMSDPISRLVATIQSRARSSAMTSIGGGIDEPSDAKHAGDGGNTGGATSSSNSKSSNSKLDDLKRAHQNMREAERECYELQKNIVAWQRLNRGKIVELPRSNSMVLHSISFVPTHCSLCADPVTIQLLNILLAVLRLERNDFDFPVSKSLVQALMNESQGMSNDLRQLKRTAIVTLVERSHHGASQVLSELQSRLTATKDVASAEILGAILEKEFDIVNEYTNLAMTVLSHAE